MPQPHPSPRSSRPSRAERRAHRTRRTRRGWWVGLIVAGGIVIGAAMAVGAAALLQDDGEPSATPPTTHRSTTTVARSSATTTVTTTPGPKCRSGLTADAPLRLWIAGDSLAWSVGNGLGKRAAATGVVAPVYESRVSSGVSSPGFFDWPKRVAEEIPRLDPEVVVFVMGTNDWMAPQPTPLDSSGQPAWKAKYEAQVQALVDALARDGRVLYWLGPPILKDSKQDVGAQAAATVIKGVIERNPDAHFVDAHTLLDADDGTYTSTVDVDSKKVLVRAGDGVHLTPEGGEFVGNALFDLIDQQCSLKAQSVPGSKQVVVETRGSTTVPVGSSATTPSPQPTTAATTPPTTAAPVVTVPPQPTVPSTNPQPTVPSTNPQPTAPK
jgi:uncharacterized protein